MTFLWHHALWLLLTLPVIVGTYLLLCRRQNKQALRYTGFKLVREAIGSTQWIRRHIPPLLLLLGLTALVLAVARPMAVVAVPSQQGTVILAIDVSLSMAVTDIAPTRFAAAQDAAAAYIRAQPQGIRVGIVAFAGYADVVQPPTLDRGDALAALERLELDQHTGIGNGLIAALLSIDPTVNIGDQYDIFGRGRQPPEANTSSLRLPRNTPKELAKRDSAAADLPTAIILISDGQGTIGFPVMKAAKIVADHGVRVYTVGVGTPYGGVANIEGYRPIHAEFEEETLKAIADITEGEYFHASTAAKVKRFYQQLTRRALLERKEREITALFIGIGFVLSLSAAALSLLWCRRFA